MNFILSLVYAPFVFVSLRYFDVKMVSIFVFLVSILWFFFGLKKGYREYIYPLFYICLSLFAYFLDNFLVLKVMPLLISIVITLFMFISYLNKQSLILYFVNRFSKNKISIKEQDYIHQSTLFWVATSCLNICIHISVFFNENIEFWIYYSSVGWYVIFLLAGILQFLHRKFFFLKELDV